jgi:tetratricopeptide (TPR) repeat protein
MATPQLKTSDIMDRIEALPKGLARSDFQVRQIQREIDKLRGVDPASAYMLDGILCTALRDFENAVAAHRNAVQLDPGREAIRYNFFASLSMFGHFKEASEVIAEMLRLGMVDDTNIKCGIWMSTLAVKHDLAKELIRKYSDLIQKQDLREGIKHMEENNSVIQHFLGQSLSLKKDADRLYNHVQSTLEKNTASVIGMDTIVSHFYGQKVLHLNYIVEEGAEKIIALNDELIEEVSSDEEIESWDSLIVAFVNGVSEGMEEFQG